MSTPVLRTKLRVLAPRPDLVSLYLIVAKWGWVEDVAGRTIKATAAALPLGLLYAQTRGRALDWCETVEKLTDELRELGWSE